MLTMQTITQRLVPTELKFQESAFTSSNATGSVIAPERVMTEVNKANREIAREANIVRYSRLRADYPITITESMFVNGIAEVRFPDFVDRPVALDALFNESNDVRPVWYLDSVHPGANVVANPSYEIVSNTLRIRIAGYYPNLVLRYQKTPGSLCYGLVASGTTTTMVAGAVTAGSLSTYNDAYKGDFVGVFPTDGDLTVHKITGYNYTTKTFTFEEGNAPAPGQNFTILSFLPESYQDLLVYGAASIFTEFPERAAASRVRYQEALAKFITSIQPAEERSPERPVQVIGAAAIGAPWGQAVRPYGYLPPNFPY